MNGILITPGLTRSSCSSFAHWSRGQLRERYVPPDAQFTHNPLFTVDTPNLSDTNLTNSFQKVSSPDLQGANSGFQNIFSFAEVQKRVAAFCNTLASASFYPSTGIIIKREIESWNQYDAKSHSPTENMSFAKSVIRTFISCLQSDINQAGQDLDAIHRARRKRRHGLRALFGAGALLALVNPVAGLTAIGAGAATSGHGGGGDTSSLERIVSNNQGYINELNSIMRLFFLVCY